MSNYTAITIGPIYNTLQLTSSPAGLWAASSLFSWVAKTLLEELHQQGIEAEQFVSPYCNYDDSGNVILGNPDDICERMRSVGVGLFHDRIIFTGEHLQDAEMSILQTEALLAEYLGCENAWTHNFLRIYAMTCDVPDGQAPLLYLGKRLAALELESSYPASECENPLLRMFENVSSTGPVSGGRNEGLKQSFLVRECSGWMFLKNGKIRDLADIARCGHTHSERKKCHQYYAVLNSDGDSMSKCLAELTDSASIREYSRKCLLYCAKAADIILNYGGMPIYAGGDDLLAILPINGKDDKNLLSVTEELRSAFNSEFEVQRRELGGKPTISFGVSIQYYKSPLFEALDRSYEMLWEAKQGGKNSLHLNLQKHSGQSIHIEMKALDSVETTEVVRQLTALIQYVELPDKEREEMVASFGYKVELFESLFQVALRSETKQHILDHLFENLFDNEEQKKFKPYLSEQKKLLLALDKAGSEPVEQLKGISRFLHFMAETEGGNA